MSQSPRIGAMVQTFMEAERILGLILSQSPRIGAMVQTYEICPCCEGTGRKSQSPRIGAMVQTEFSENGRKLLMKVSIPSNRGNGSDHRFQKVEAILILCLNPLESGQWFRQRLFRLTFPAFHVSIPSNRGNGSDVKDFCLRYGLKQRSQSPRIGAMVQTHV
ncbi:hypothetical protein dsmv_3684 [Desulfococcus multivorans DSM 2059]|uniref:Uncharacterized protein n=1 Tax=Desulfococcus multivorans DSM 2059 TaxID=1121405 RepID=S7UGL5_DESML|nr:hypothetical protein dsmv_3684 [Desulfococcus multivorans DSM 2059]